MEVWRIAGTVVEVRCIFLNFRQKNKYCMVANCVKCCDGSTLCVTLSRTSMHEYSSRAQPPCTKTLLRDELKNYTRTF